MKILIVATAESVHTARWLGQIADQGWDLHLFPSIDYGVVHPEMKGVTTYNRFYAKDHCQDKSVLFTGMPVYAKNIAFTATKVLRQLSPAEHAERLCRLIREIRPDLIHSMEIQAAGYLTWEARKRYEGAFPPWIVTNWGSDIFYFQQFPDHQNKIHAVLDACDYYTCECLRDVSLAKQYGFRGRVLGVTPNAGGIDLRLASDLRQSGPVSSRRVIMLKGYQHWTGRALIGLKSLEACSDLLPGYAIVIYSASDEVIAASRIFERNTGTKVTIIPRNTPQREMLKYHGSARISIGLSLSDGISTSFLEAMAMGSFPVQSWTACADEWIEDGKTGLLVPPEDKDAVTMALRRALSDDDLVDQAAGENYRTTAKRLDHHQLKQRAVQIYETAAGGRGCKPSADGI